MHMNQFTDDFLRKSRPVFRPDRKQPPLIGRILVEMGELAPADLVRALALQTREEGLFGELLLAHGMISEEGLFRALARQFHCDIADLRTEEPDIRLIRAVGPETCLHLGVIPWKRIGTTTVIATSRPDQFARIKEGLAPSLGKVLMVVASDTQLHEALLQFARHDLAERAETRVQDRESCRSWNSSAMARFIAGMMLAVVTGMFVAPQLTMLALTGWAVLAQMFNTALKAAAAIANRRANRGSELVFCSRRDAPVTPVKLPQISILVPLFREREIAHRLVRRLGRLRYPRELLEICLILEEDDRVTQQALAATDLPHHFRTILVPGATLKTKPRALNYALDFCRGSIIGVYDAEDAPEPDQLHKVARRFSETPPDVACLQGVLDFYNPRQNWLARCFTIEYAAWFRVVLPGLERLGFVIPLGGTTIFFRRQALERVGAWDAHNVTEDADLGVRLARHGYRTELLPTLTEEEANTRVWPWVRQRSRWLKGYAITWAVHMRAPRRLMADLGPWRFFGMQLLFLGALSQFLLAPFLLSFWALPLGLAHPLQGVLSATALYLLAVVFLLAEAVSMAISIHALAPARHRGLWWWVPALHAYFPLATLAAYKGLWEMITKPFFWDKTAHGHSNARAGIVSRANPPGRV